MSILLVMLGFFIFSSTCLLGFTLGVIMAWSFQPYDTEAFVAWFFGRVFSLNVPLAMLVVWLTITPAVVFYGGLYTIYGIIAKRFWAK